MKKYLPSKWVLLICFLIVLAGGYFLLSMEKRLPVTLTATDGDKASHVIRRDTEPSPSHIEPAQAPTVREIVKPDTLASAMRSANPYALAIKLRNEQGPGAFAVAANLDATCRLAFGKTIAVKPFLEGTQAAPRGADMPVANAGLPPEVQAKRAAAIQEIQARCQPFLADRSTTEPLPNDASGVAYRDAISRLKFRRLTAASADSALRELESQGMLAKAWGMLGSSDGGFSYFEGQPRGGLSQDEFFRAMQLGSLLATSVHQAGPADLRMLAACAYSAQCGDDPSQIVLADLPADSASAARIKALAMRIAAAFEASRVDAFQPPRS
ncbi:hypothetical protein ACQ86G_23755 [Roseateles chitinivorans]|uniref:hypothetical protein n=1 Tax=Roseateles chitinivorans TaxID=2917965 RepID=UPI003D6726E8